MNCEESERVRETLLPSVTSQISVVVIGCVTVVVSPVDTEGVPGVARKDIVGVDINEKYS